MTLDLALVPLPSAEKVSMFQDVLIGWHEHCQRSFIWRHAREPFAVLVAEFLLQKTNAEKVEPIYQDFIARYPTAHDLSQADEGEVHATLQSLGLHYRASRLVGTAKVIVEKYHGAVPERVSELLTLPGVGDYMANAVACFAFGQPTPLIDTNSVRVLSRVFNFKGHSARPRTDKLLWQFASSLVYASNPREYNWALLDLAHLVCMVRKPICSTCPLRDICHFNQEEGRDYDNE